MQHLMSSIFFPSMDRAVEVDYRLLADGRLAAWALLCRLYAFDHGRLPATLRELVPRYIASVPIDPMAAGGVAPLRMTTAGGKPRICSVGKNGIDDGGAEPLKTGPLGKRDARSDVVVKLTVTPRQPFEN